MRSVVTALMILSISIPSHSQERPVLFPHVLNTKIDFESGISYPEHYIQSRPLAQNEVELLEYFEKAQSYYAVKSYDLAKIYYEKVAHLIHLDDWKETHRRAITLSLARLAELDRSELWASKAVSFGPDVLPEGFKYPLHSTIEWDVSDWKEDFDFILINGRQINLKSIRKVKIPLGEHRIVFLSKLYAPQTVHVTSQQTPFLRPVKIPFVSGTCEKPVLSESTITHAIVFYPDCQRVRTHLTWLKEDKLTPSKAEPNVFASTFHEDKKVFYKEPWFLVVATVVIGGLVYYAIDRKKQKGESSAPSSTVIGEF